MGGTASLPRCLRGPPYRELARKVLEFENRPAELLDLLREFHGRGLKVGSLEDEDSDGRRIPLAEIDPSRSCHV